MTDMIERVAKAIEGVEYFLNGSTVPTRIGPGLSPQLARAAIAAMREPTEEMYQGVCALNKMWRDSNSAEIWQAMIDAALGDK